MLNSTWQVWYKRTIRRASNLLSSELAERGATNKETEVSEQSEGTLKVWSLLKNRKKSQNIKNDFNAILEVLLLHLEQN